MKIWDSVYVFVFIALLLCWKATDLKKVLIAANIFIGKKMIKVVGNFFIAFSFFIWKTFLLFYLQTKLDLNVFNKFTSENFFVTLCNGKDIKTWGNIFFPAFFRDFSLWLDGLGGGVASDTWRGPAM